MRRLTGGRSAVVAGVPGSGKTTVFDELERELRAEDVLVIRLRAKAANRLDWEVSRATTAALDRFARDRAPARRRRFRRARRRVERSLTRLVHRYRGSEKGIQLRASRVAGYGSVTYEDVNEKTSLRELGEELRRFADTMGIRVALLADDVGRGTAKVTQLDQLSDLFDSLDHAPRTAKEQQDWEWILTGRRPAPDDHVAVHTATSAAPVRLFVSGGPDLHDRLNSSAYAFEELAPIADADLARELEQRLARAGIAAERVAIAVLAEAAHGRPGRLSQLERAATDGSTSTVVGLTEAYRAIERTYRDSVEACEGQWDQVLTGDLGGVKAAVLKEMAGRPEGSIADPRKAESTHPGGLAAERPSQVAQAVSALIHDGVVRGWEDRDQHSRLSFESPDQLRWVAEHNGLPDPTALGRVVERYSTEQRECLQRLAGIGGPLLPLAPREVRLLQQPLRDGVVALRADGPVGFSIVDPHLRAWLVARATANAARDASQARANEKVTLVIGGPGSGKPSLIDSLARSRDRRVTRLDLDLRYEGESSLREELHSAVKPLQDRSKLQAQLRAMERRALGRRRRGDPQIAADLKSGSADKLFKDLSWQAHWMVSRELGLNVSGSFTPAAIGPREAVERVDLRNVKPTPAQLIERLGVFARACDEELVVTVADLHDASEADLHEVVDLCDQVHASDQPVRLLLSGRPTAAAALGRADGEKGTNLYDRLRILRAEGPTAEQAGAYFQERLVRHGLPRLDPTARDRLTAAAGRDWSEVNDLSQALLQPSVRGRQVESDEQVVDAVVEEAYSARRHRYRKLWNGETLQASDTARTLLERMALAHPVGVQVARGDGRAWGKFENARQYLKREGLAVENRSEGGIWLTCAKPLLARFVAEEVLDQPPPWRPYSPQETARLRRFVDGPADGLGVTRAESDRDWRPDQPDLPDWTRPGRRTTGLSAPDTGRPRRWEAVGPRASPGASLG